MNIKPLWSFCMHWQENWWRSKWSQTWQKNLHKVGETSCFFRHWCKPEMWCFWISILLSIGMPAFHTSQEMDMCNFKLSLKADAICFCSNYCNLSVFDDRWCHLSIEVVISLIQKVSPQKTFQLVNYTLLVWITFNLVN